MKKTLTSRQEPLQLPPLKLTLSREYRTLTTKVENSQLHPGMEVTKSLQGNGDILDVVLEYMQQVLDLAGIDFEVQ